jgi:hypothetical protein
MTTALDFQHQRAIMGAGIGTKMPIHWEQILSEFDAMGNFDQLCAVTKEQMAWLGEVSENAPVREALDLGFGCGFSAIAIERGGCGVTCINNEAPTVPRRIEAEQRYERICGRRPTSTICLR